MLLHNTLRFKLHYDGVFQDQFKSLDAAIQRAVTTFRNNPDMEPEVHYFVSMNSGSSVDKIICVIRYDGNNIYVF